MAVFNSVPKEIFDTVVGQHRDLITAMEQRHEREVTRLNGIIDQERTRYAELVKQVIEIKRHEQGMNPENFDPQSLMPEHGLGPKTIAACDEFAAGDPELRRYLVGKAHQYWQQNHELDKDERDIAVAKRIIQGDQG